MGSQSVPFLNVTLSLAQPKQAGGALVADAAGGATWNLVIPPSALGLSVWFQAAQYNQVTNLVGTVVQ